MKKFSTIILLVLCSLSINAQNKFFERNKEFEFGFNVGGLHLMGYDENEIPKNCGINTYYIITASVYGVYIDYGFCGKHHNDVRVGKWDDTKGNSIHLGYKCPITNWFTVIPLIGYINEQQGKTDGYDWTVTSTGIKNKFNGDSRFSQFDYGTKVQFNIPFWSKDYCDIIPKFNIDIAMTRNMMMLGGGFQINF